MCKYCEEYENRSYIHEPKVCEALNIAIKRFDVKLDYGISVVYAPLEYTESNRYQWALILNPDFRYCPYCGRELQEEAVHES